MERYRYTHGANNFDEYGQINEGIIDFSSNINPLGMPVAVITAAKDAIELSNIYPDSACRLLTVRLAGFERVSERSLFCAGGASDIIFRAAYAMKPKRILVTAPSFSDYERAGKAAGADIAYYPLKCESFFSITRSMALFIRETLPEMVYICNPNNPTGVLTNIDTIEEIASVCRSMDTILIVDECFLDFVPDSSNYSAKALLNKYKNVMIVKAFTKIFAMPGLRLGYAISENESLLDRMRICGADWPVSTAAQAAGIAAIECSGDYIDKSVQYVQKERERMINEFKLLGLTVYPSSANFILFHCRWDINLHDALYERGFLIRDCKNFSGLTPGYYRTAVLTADKNTRLLEAMKEVKAFWQR